MYVCAAKQVAHIVHITDFCFTKNHVHTRQKKKAKKLIGKQLTPVCSSSLSSSLELGSIILSTKCVYLSAANSNLYAIRKSIDKTGIKSAQQHTHTHTHERMRSHAHHSPILLMLVVGRSLLSLV